MKRVVTVKAVTGKLSRFGKYHTDSKQSAIK
jgi:hypothetical protein